LVADDSRGPFLKGPLSQQYRNPTDFLKNYSAATGCGSSGGGA